MSVTKVLSKESFSITGRGIVLDLVHAEQGLPYGTILTSKLNNRQWRLKARVLFDHAVDLQRIFKDETTEYMLLTFATEEKREESRRKIKAKEDKNIYQYFIAPINHEFKPEDGEELEIL